MSETTTKTVKTAEKVDVSASLISAVREDDLVSVKKLVNFYGLSYCECGNGGYILLFVAIELGHIEIAKFLLQEGAKAGCDTDNVSTPLHLAARRGFSGLVELLLEKNVAVDARNYKNETPLHLAAKEGCAEVVEVLLNNCASVTAQTNEGATPLFLVAEARHEAIVKMLLKHARVNLQVSTEMRNSALLNQVLLCNPSICEEVNQLVVCIVTKDDDRSKIVDELVDIGFTLSREFVNESLLLAAISKNYIKLIDSILKNEANHDIATHYPQLLHTAVKTGRVEITELFLKSGFNANASDGQGKTSLSYSLNCEEDVRYVEIIRLLLAYDADITKAPDLLHEAVTKEIIEVCKVLIENGANINALDTDGRTPLFLAVSDERSSIANEGKGEGTEQIDTITGDKIADLLLKTSADGRINLSTADEGKREGTEQIEKTTGDKIVELLLKSSADVRINVRGFTAFHHAVLRGQIRTVSVFVECGVDVDTRAEDGSTPLFLAAQEGDADIVKILCENNADVNAGLAETSPLYIAVFNRKVDTVKMLLKFGAEVDFDCGTVFNSRTTFEEVNICADRVYIKELISNHVGKLKAAGLRGPEWRRNYSTTFRFLKMCAEEIERLKNQRLNPRLTLHDILMSGTNPTYAKKRLLMQKLESFNFERFPNYRDVILSNVRKCKFRLQLLQSGQKWLNTLVKTSNRLNGKKDLLLPVEILEQIVSYLSNSEVKCLIFCGEALKRQLSR